MKKLLLLLLVITNVVCIQLTAQTRTYYYVCKKSYDKNGVQSSCNTDIYYTFTNTVAYMSDENGNDKGGIKYKYRGMTEDGNLWYCNYMEQPNVSYLPGIGMNTYTTTSWAPNLGQLIVATDYSVVNTIFAGGITYVYVRSTPSSTNSNRYNTPSLRR